MVIFSDLKDPRTTYRGNFQHELIEVLFLAITACLCGINQWKYIEIFGNSQLDWYRKYFAFENGIPSNVTLGRLFASIDSVEFGKLFIHWVKTSGLIKTNKQVAIDGKRLRGSYDKASNQAALHIVSAYAAEAGVCIAQKSCDMKSNEITAIPEILEQIDKGSIITIDAMGCQKDIAEKIVDNGSDYILAVKQNQEELHQQVIKMFEINKRPSVNQTMDIGHGRIETRKCSVVTNLKFMDVAQNWKGLKSVIKVETERTIKLTSEVETNTRYYISSLSLDACEFNQYIRNHWTIENNLHWILDEVFKEDKSRRRKGNSPENFNIIAKMAMALITKIKKKNQALDEIRANAGWSCDFRDSILRFK